MTQDEAKKKILDAVREYYQIAHAPKPFVEGKTCAVRESGVEHSPKTI